MDFSKSTDIKPSITEKNLVQSLKHTSPKPQSWRTELYTLIAATGLAGGITPGAATAPEIASDLRHGTSEHAANVKVRFIHSVIDFISSVNFR